jgi:hypothetical protein
VDSFLKFCHLQERLMQPLVRWFDAMTGANSCVTGHSAVALQPHCCLNPFSDDMFKFAQPEASVAAVAAWLQVAPELWCV